MNPRSTYYRLQRRPCTFSQMFIDGRILPAELKRTEIASQLSRPPPPPPPPPPSSSPPLSIPSTLGRRPSAGDCNDRMKITVEDLLNVKLKPSRPGGNDISSRSKIGTVVNDTRRHTAR